MGAYEQRHSFHLRRTIWAYLTRKPDASIPRIARETGLSFQTIQNVLGDLERLGYITQGRTKTGRRAPGARCILVSLY
jgi:hypothetical protein